MSFLSWLLWQTTFEYCHRSFLPRTTLFIVSRAETPVWIISFGYVRDLGLSGSPLMDLRGHQYDLSNSLLTARSIVSTPIQETSGSVHRYPEKQITHFFRADLIDEQASTHPKKSKPFQRGNFGIRMLRNDHIC